MVFFNGVMGKNILENGKEENNMVKEFMFLLKEKKGKVYGKMEKELIGLIDNFFFYSFF